MMLRARLARAVPEEAPAAHLPAMVEPTASVTPLFPLLQRTDLAVAALRPRLSWRALSFALVVLLPAIVAAVYYFALAADQYVAEFRLSLRTTEAPRIESLALFGGDPARASAGTESQIVAQFIASRAIVDELDPKLDLRRMFASPDADWWARLSLPAAIEDLVYYWRGQVDPFYDATTGTIVVRVRAFTPQDALTLAQGIVGASENLVNELSARSRRDALHYAEAEVEAAETRLKAALAALREFRDRAGLIDPAKAAEANEKLATQLRDDLLKANAQLTSLKAFVRDETPTIRVLKARIHALEVEQQKLSREMTASSPAGPMAQAAKPPLSQQLGSFETLDAERKFAETTYQHALEALDRARDNADRQHIYIESFVPPSLPQTALFPRRWRSFGTVALIAFSLWAIGCLAVQSIKDHL